MMPPETLAEKLARIHKAVAAFIASAVVVVTAAEVAFEQEFGTKLTVSTTIASLAIALGVYAAPKNRAV